jgi:hypothetical protein
MSDNTDKRTATQRIEDLEKVVTGLYNNMNEAFTALRSMQNVQSDLVVVKEALKIINKKVEAIVQVANESTGITVDSVSALVVKMNVEDLKAQVESYVNGGQLAPTDTVAADSYLVCEELTADGTVTNPRVQFRLDSQEKTTADLFLGKKAGDTVSFGENKLDAKVLEVYTLLPPKTETAPETAQSAPEAAQPAAEAAPAEAAPAQALQELPAESSSGFELQYHGTPESQLANPAAESSEATA